MTAGQSKWPHPRPEGARGKLTLITSTFYRLLPQTLAQKVIAVRDIEPGEEITHSCERPVQRSTPIDGP